MEISFPIPLDTPDLRDVNKSLKLPPTFMERHSPCSISYRLSINVRRTGFAANNM
jgi:hypothetical protein